VAGINDAWLEELLEIEDIPPGVCDGCGGELYGEEIEIGLCVFCEEGIEREKP